MTFDEVLTQALELLKRQGRVSYSALKRRFDLDDDYLNDLKDELLYVHESEVEADERGFTWTGVTEDLQETTSQSNQTAPQSVGEQAPTAQEISAPAEAERRQLTVMFCDLVDSTRLSSQLDPEEYRDVVRAYQTACTEVIRRYDGHIAQYLGDGLLVYFSYPQAHEDDALRAVHTGLGIIEAVEALNTSLEPAQGITLAVRLGIHTGLVVVGDLGGAGRQEQLALGETPNIAARIQGLATPNTLVISDATYRLIQGYFECQDLGAQTLRGVAEPIQVYRVLQASGARGRLDVAVTRGLTPLVGRESEVTLLLERWAQVKDGQGHVVLLTGDAGIGKSRLVQMLKEHVANEPHTRWECRSAEYSQNTALFPLVDLFQRILRFEAHETPDEKLGKLEGALSQYRFPLEESVLLFAPLLALPVPEHRYPPLNLSPQRQRQKTLETIVVILLELAERQPVLFIVEDLHWTDPTTLELLTLVLDQTPAASMLVLLTCRPHFQPAWHHRSYLTEMTLNHLSHVQVAQIVHGMTEGKTLPREVLAQIVAKTDGVPLFVEEITKAILESGQLKAIDGHYALTGSLSTFAIPATLQDSLMARLDRLMTAKGVAQMGATIGRQFAYALLQAVSQLDALTLQRELGRLVEAELLYQRGVPPQATFTFKHALIQDAAAQSLLKSTRQQYHQRIAQVLEAQFPETAETEPELLAHHYTEAGRIAQAIPYWQQAGQKAVERSANVEAISHLTKGVELLPTLSDTPERIQQEILLQVTLGVALSAAKGWGAPEVEQAHRRARELCQQVGETPHLFPVLWGLFGFYLVCGELQTARELAAQALNLAQHIQDPVCLAEAHFAMGNTLLWCGELAAARAHLEQGLAHYHPQRDRAQVLLRGYDPGVACLAFLGRVLWHLGYPDQAVQCSNEALTCAHDLSHPFSLSWALSWTAALHQLRREDQEALGRAEAAFTHSTEQGFPFFAAHGMVLRGWALVQQGQETEGMCQLHQGLTAYQATGAAVERSHWVALLAEAYGYGGQIEEGLHVLANALAKGHRHGNRYYEPELYRLKGKLLLQQHAVSTVHQAEACFHQALAIARHQQAKSLELRAAMSLARLWQQQGKRAEAHELLASIYGWFTEGIDTADLQEAKALLDALA